MLSAAIDVLLSARHLAWCSAAFLRPWCGGLGALGFVNAMTNLPDVTTKGGMLYVGFISHDVDGTLAQALYETEADGRLFD